MANDDVSELSVVMVTGVATERSIDIEIAAKIDSLNGVNVTPVSFVTTQDVIFGTDVVSLNCDSVFSPYAYPKLYRLLRDIKPDIVHNQSHLIGAPIRLVSRLARIPILVSSEHSPRSSFDLIKRFASNSTNWLSDAIVANSHSTMDSLHWSERRMLQLAGVEMITIQHGVDIERIRKALDREDTPDLPEDDLVVGFAGRLVEEKQVHKLIEAIALARDDGVNYSLLIVGDGPCRESLITLANKLGVSRYIKFHDFMPRHKVWAFMHGVDIMAYPSAYEGFGVAAIESMATGTATILSDIPVYQEIAGDRSWIIKPEPTKIAKALNELSDEEVRKRRGDHQKQHVEKNFRLTNTVHEHLRLYENLCGRYDP